MKGKWTDEITEIYEKSGKPPPVHFQKAVSLVAADDTKHRGSLSQVFISQRKRDQTMSGQTGSHAEDFFLNAHIAGSIPDPKWFYISSTPCHECTPKIIKHFSNSNLPYIYVSTIFNPYDKKNLNAVMRLLVRGYKIESLEVDDYDDLLDEISFGNDGKKVEYREGLHQAAAILISEIGQERYEYTEKVLGILRDEAKKYRKKAIKNDEEIDYTQNIREKIWKVIKKHRQTTINCIHIQL